MTRYYISRYTINTWYRVSGMFDSFTRAQEELERFTKLYPENSYIIGQDN